MMDKTLVAADRYLKTGCHIGTKFKSGDMQKFVFKTRKDGLKVLDVATIDERIRIAIRFLAQFKPERIAVASRKLYGQPAVEKFAQYLGAKAYTGRFVPGTFTNPTSKKFFEPAVLIVTEPDSDFQAVKEAKIIKIPIVALASTNNRLRFVDLAIPVNNKGRKSLALVYWLLAKDLSKEFGLIKKDDDFKAAVEEFEYQLKESDREMAEEPEAAEESREKAGEQA